MTSWLANCSGVSDSVVVSISAGGAGGGGGDGRARVTRLMTDADSRRFLSRPRGRSLGLVRLRLGRHRLFEDSRPVELHVGIVLFEQVYGVFVDRGAADADAGRRAEPIEDAMLSASSPARALHERGRFVAAPITIEAQVWQRYFRFCARALRCGAAFARPVRALVARAAGAALRARPCRLSSGSSTGGRTLTDLLGRRLRRPGRLAGRLPRSSRGFAAGRRRRIAAPA